MAYHPRRQEIIEWLGRLRNLTELTGKTEAELRNHSYPTWGRVGRAWDHQLGTGGTYTMRAIVWYQHIHKPGSTDSRPAVVLKAIAEHLDRCELHEAPK